MMRDEARVYVGLAAFFIVIGVVYWFTSYEDAGSVMLAASALMGLVAGGSIWFLSRYAPARPEDDANATMADGAGGIGVFPTQSIWPFAVGLSAALFASGFAFGIWLVMAGGAGFVLALLGYIAEARRETLPSERTPEGSSVSSE
jgi:hypothetical protein